jgi:hypothetical protein
MPHAKGCLTHLAPSFFHIPFFIQKKMSVRVFHSLSSPCIRIRQERLHSIVFVANLGHV